MKPEKNLVSIEMYLFQVKWMSIHFNADREGHTKTVRMGGISLVIRNAQTKSVQIVISV